MTYWQHLLDILYSNQAVYVLTVIENSGSSPGRKGFKMLVAQDGFIYGSIGGGIMEIALVKEAQKLLLDESPPTFIKQQIHRGSIKNGSGMICSGEQTVAFHCLNSIHLPVIHSIMECIKNGENGSLCLTPTSYVFSHKPLERQFDCQIISNKDWVFEEHVGFRETLYIVGGGHVGFAVSEILMKLGFHVTIFDNRKDLNTLENNSFAHERLVVDYKDIHDYIDQGDHSYVVIMTNKYIDDKLVLHKLIRNDYKFIGVLGSKAKLKTLWKDLHKEGFTNEELDKIYAPIGLPIKSETPIEIAVSIAAQIIQVKNKNRK
jgi:xanthine dehydrogenase accessory factor